MTQEWERIYPVLQTYKTKKFDELDYIKIQDFYSTNDTMDTLNRHTEDWKRLLQCPESTRTYYHSKMQRERLQINGKKKYRSPIRQKGEEFEKAIFKRVIPTELRSI